MNSSEYRQTIFDLSVDRLGKQSNDADKLLLTLDKAGQLLFEGKEEIQPVKWHQIQRIYKLAVTCIEIVRILWPYLRIIIKIIKK
jgi:hypothetical protein